MERLIENELMNGGLMQVSQPHLVERYNKALEGLGLPRTSHTEFSIDATGYSPQVADDLGDEHYLDPNQVNRRFIILSPAQKHLPVVHASFSSTTDVVHEFFRRNAKQLQALTLKDVVYGEIEDAVFRIDSLNDVISMKSAEFELRTGDGLIEKSQHLQSLLDRFENEPDSWRNDDLQSEIVELARLCGDIRGSDFVPRHTQFEHKAFWTRHFEGLYVFHENDGAVVIGASDQDTGDQGKDGEADDDQAEGKLRRYMSRGSPKQIYDLLTGAGKREGSRLKQYLSLGSPRDVYKFLQKSGRIEPLNPQWLTRSVLIDRRIEQYVRRAITEAEPDRDLVRLEPLWVKNWIHNNLDELSEDGTFPFLTRLQRYLAGRSDADLDNTPMDLRFMAIRARPDHP